MVVKSWTTNLYSGQDTKSTFKQWEIKEIHYFKRELAQKTNYISFLHTFN